MTIKSEKFGTHTTALKDSRGHIEVTFPVKLGTSTALLMEMSTDWPEVMLDGPKRKIRARVAPLDVLYALKMSHRFLKNSKHFDKTRVHIKHMRKMKAQISNPEWYELRCNETYNYGHPNLKVGKGDFFNSNFNYVYDHDSIHEAVKLLDRPAYTYYMSGDAEVFCSKDAFFANEATIQYLGVLEETYVLALERSQIPNNFEVDPRISFNIALEKVCTSITSGWFREFAWENYDLIQGMYDESYVHRFKLALEKGDILPFNNS